MKRRTYLKSMLAAATIPAVQAQTAVKGKAAPKARPIELHVDLAVDPKREQEMLSNFEKVFKPVAKRQPGYIDLQMLKLTSNIAGPVPPGGRFRFVLQFESEALRQTWIASKDHARVWPSIENTLTDKNFPIWLYEIYQ